MHVVLYTAMAMERARPDVRHQRATPAIVVPPAALDDDVVVFAPEAPLAIPELIEEGPVDLVAVTKGLVTGMTEPVVDTRHLEQAWGELNRSLLRR